MIIVDINILIYAHSADAPQHPRARAWVEQALSSTEQVGIPWAVVHAFLRLMTKHMLLAQPFTIAEAAAIVDEWFTLPAVTLVEPGPRYWSILQELLITMNLSGDMVSDSHIAALAIENGASVCTADRDFRRFDGLTIVNPLA